jgi:hypothetical protein
MSRDHHTTLSVVSDNLEVIERIKAPRDLSREQRDEFERIVSVQPADWFSRGNIAALAQYSRHVIAARRIAEAIETCIADGDVEQLDVLLKAQARESKAICKLMTALRLTPRAVSPRSVSIKKLSQVPSPWTGPREQRR